MIGDNAAQESTVTPHVRRVRKIQPGMFEISTALANISVGVTAAAALPMKPEHPKEIAIAAEFGR
jgi:hypothetical protein